MLRKRFNRTGGGTFLMLLGVFVHSCFAPSDTSFVGWGYPSVWSTPTGYRTILYRSLRTKTRARDRPPADRTDEPARRARSRVHLQAACPRRDAEAGDNISPHSQRRALCTQSSFDCNCSMHRAAIAIALRNFALALASCCRHRRCRRRRRRRRRRRCPPSSYLPSFPRVSVYCCMLRS